MGSPDTTPVLFRVAGGPRLGFGHIVRAISLAKAMQVKARLSVRGTSETTRVATRMGASVDEEGFATVLETGDVKLVVIDDPHVETAEAALIAARRHGVPVASIHDLGLAPIASDLAIDGSLAHSVTQPQSAEARRSWPAGELLLGPRYMVLDPALLQEIAAHRRVLAPGTRELSEGRRVMVSLGGGPRLEAGLTIARAIAEAYADTRVTLATGFTARASHIATGHPRVRLLESPGVLRCELARADVAVLAGGVTLYESAALGVPAVAVAVVPAQWPTVRAFDRIGAARAAGLLHTSSRERPLRVIARVVRAVGELLANDEALATMAMTAREHVDGRGAIRVATALKKLMEHGTASDFVAAEAAEAAAHAASFAASAGPTATLPETLTSAEALVNNGGARLSPSPATLAAAGAGNLAPDASDARDARDERGDVFVRQVGPKGQEWSAV